MNQQNIKRPPFKVILVFVLFSLPGLTYAEPKSIRCTYLLEEWKIEDLKKYANCPSGKEGLGKPWRSDTYSFNLSPDTTKTPVERIAFTCMEGSKTRAGELTVTPSFLVFTFPNDPIDVKYSGKYEQHSIDRETLRDMNGAQCEIIKIDVSKNKI